MTPEDAVQHLIGINKESSIVHTQEFDSTLDVPELDTLYSLNIPDIWKFQDENDYQEIVIDPGSFEADLQANPWNARSIKEILRKYKEGDDSLKHVKRIKQSDNIPIALTTMPAGIKSTGNEHPYMVLDGFHRLAKALLENRDKIKARVYKTKWEEGPREVSKESAEDAKGILGHKYGDLSKLKQGALVNFLLQLHDAKKSGRHYDMRIESPEGLLSWAIPKAELPRPGGKKRLAVQQPLHSKEYKKFEGEIPEGEYGAGTVKKEREGRVLITDVSPDKITFVQADKSQPEKFTLVKTKDKNWLLMNTTRTEKPVSGDKPKMKEVSQDEVDKLFSGDNLVMPKYDGSFILTPVFKDKVEDISHRTSKVTGRPITHSERTGSYKIKPGKGVPQGRSLLQSELYVTDKDKEKALPAAILSGLLNSTIENSSKEIEDKNYKLRHGVFDILEYGGKDVTDKTYPERRELMKELLKHLPKDNFRMIPGETNPDKQRQLWEQIRREKHPVTEEGVVAYPIEGGTPTKAKTYDEWDVIIEGLTEGKGKYHNTVT